MTEEISETILIKIKKLLNLANDPSNEHEAANAAAKAQEMLLKFNLSEEQLDGVRTDRAEKYTREFYTGHRTGVNEVRWKILLAFAVAKGNLCKVVHIGGSKQICWIGKPSNIEVAKFLYETLVHDLEQISDRKWKAILQARKLAMADPERVKLKDPSLFSVHGKTWKKSFFLGAVETISERLREGLSELSTDTQMNALIVTSNKELQNYFKELYPRTRSFGGDNGNIHYAGYNAGREAGKTIQFRRGVNGSGGASGPALIKG